MKFSEWMRLLQLALVTCVSIAGAQIKSSTPPQIDHPVYTLAFKPRAAVPELKASLFAPPILCSEDGTAYYGVPEPPTYRERTIQKLDLQEPRSFPYREVEGLYDTRFVAFFPGGSDLYVLVDDAKDSERARYVVSKGISPNPAGSKERHAFVLKFDKSGRYINRIQLPDQFSFIRFAALEDGSFVALAIDRANATPRLPQLNSEGKIVRYLRLPSALGSDGSQPSGSMSREGNVASTGARLTKWFFVPVRHKILLFAADINQVLEIGPDGVRREVNIAIPKGYFFDGVLSSNDRWLFLVPRQVEWEPGKVGGRLMSSDYTLYEVDFNDGKFIRELKGAPTPNLGIACERNGVFRGFSIGRDSRYVLWTAELPH